MLWESWWEVWLPWTRLMHALHIRPLYPEIFQIRRCNNSLLQATWNLDFGNAVKKMDFFPQNIFVWALEVQKSHVVLTDYCQFYGLPLTSHVILSKNCNQKICWKLGRNNTGSQWKPIKLTVVSQYNMIFCEPLGTKWKYSEEKINLFYRIIKLRSISYRGFQNNLDNSSTGFVRKHNWPSIYLITLALDSTQTDRPG